LKKWHLCETESLCHQIRVARWYIFKAKIPVWVNFLGSCNGRVGIFYGHLVYFTAVWYISRPFGIFWPFGMICVNLAYFARLGIFGPKKSGNPARDRSDAASQILRISTFYPLLSVSATFVMKPYIGPRNPPTPRPPRLFVRP
jgi:hypothetical protein